MASDTELLRQQKEAVYYAYLDITIDVPAKVVKYRFNPDVIKRL